MVRLQKFLAEAGIASRRAAEKLILEGRVSVNGQSTLPLGTKIDPARDRVVVDGRPLKAKKKLYLALNKPPGYICSRKDPEGRPTVFDLMPREWSNLYPVGRLDFRSEGLLLITNDGDFCLRLTHPRYGAKKSYRVTIEGRMERESIRTLLRGVYHEGERLKAETVKVLSESKRYSVFEVALSEGKNREVRRLFESQGVEVKKLQRIRIGKIQLGELRLGRWRTLTEAEIKSLLTAV